MNNDLIKGLGERAISTNAKEDIADEGGFAIPLSALKNNHHRSYHRPSCPRIKGKKVVKFKNANEVDRVFPDTMRVYPCHMCRPDALPELKRHHGFNFLEYLKRFNSYSE